MVRAEKLDLDWIDFVNAPVFILDIDNRRLLRANQSLRRILPQDTPPTPAPLDTIIGSGAADTVIDFIRAMPADGTRNTLSVTCPTLNGPMMLIMHLKKIPGEDAIWVITVDERTLFFEGVKSENSEETFRGIIQALPIGIDIFDASWRGLFYNAFSDSLYLYDPYYDLEHHEWFERAFPDPEERQRSFTLWSNAQRALEVDPSQPQTMEWRVFCRDGQYRVLSNRMSKIGSYYSFIYWDITEQRRLEDQLRILASTDMLTHVHNRRYFFDEAEGILTATAADKTALCVLLLDIDHFKAINDSFGHRAGDEALIAVSALCRSALRKTDLLARLGGEEFAILLPRTSLEEARIIAGRLLRTVSDRKIETSAGPLALTVSIGVAPLEAPTRSIDQLLEQADAALYRAKRAGRNRIAVSADASTRATTRRRTARK